MKFSENSNACDTSFMLGFSLLLGCLQLTGSAQLLGFFCWVNYQPFYGNIASFFFLDATLVLPALQLNISCISGSSLLSSILLHFTGCFSKVTFTSVINCQLPIRNSDFHIQLNIFCRSVSVYSSTISTLFDLYQVWTLLIIWLG